MSQIDNEHGHGNGHHSNGHHHLDKVSAAGLLIALGIVFGDIGTSPLYVLKAIAGNEIISEEIIFASNGEDFAEAAAEAAKNYATEMAGYLKL